MEVTVFFEHYAVKGRQIYYTRVTAQIINHMNSSLINGQMARNKVRLKGIEILSAASLLSTDIWVNIQFGETYKWQIEKPRSSKTNTCQSF